MLYQLKIVKGICFLSPLGGSTGGEDFFFVCVFLEVYVMDNQSACLEVEGAREH